MPRRPKRKGPSDLSDGLIQGFKDYYGNEWQKWAYLRSLKDAVYRRGMPYITTTPCPINSALGWDVLVCKPKDVSTHARTSPRRVHVVYKYSPVLNPELRKLFNSRKAAVEWAINSWNQAGGEYRLAVTNRRMMWGVEHQDHLVMEWICLLYFHHVYLSK